MSKQINKYTAGTKSHPSNADVLAEFVDLNGYRELKGRTLSAKTNEDDSAMTLYSYDHAIAIRLTDDPYDSEASEYVILDPSAAAAYSKTTGQHAQQVIDAVEAELRGGDELNIVINAASLHQVIRDVSAGANPFRQLTVQVSADDMYTDGENARIEALGADGANVRISFPAEDGGPGPVNSINIWPERTDYADSVTVTISTGDPRGGFVIGVERDHKTGALILILPYEIRFPGELRGHEKMTPLADGGDTINRYVIGHVPESLQDRVALTADQYQVRKYAEEDAAEAIARLNLYGDQSTS